MRLREDQLLPELRERHRRLAAKERELLNDPRRDRQWVAQEIPRLRAEAHAAAAALAAESGVLVEITERKRNMADYLPGKNEGAALRIAEAERTRRKVASDPALGRTSFADLRRLAETADVVTLADIRRELRFRAEAGDQDATAAGPQIDRRLDEVASALPDTVKRAAEFERISTLEENVGYVLGAIESGGDDLGATYDLHRTVRAKLDAGEIDKDGARELLQQQPSAA